MSMEIRCDGCCEMIEDGDPWVSVEVNGQVRERATFDYHETCWEELSAYLEFNRRTRQELALLPVCEEPPEPGAMGRSVWTLPIDGGAKVALRDAGIRTLGQLTERTGDDLLALRGISWRRLEAIEETLTARGLRLRAPRVVV